MYTEQYIQTRKIEMNWNILLAVVLLPFSLAYSEYSKNVKMLSAATFDAEVIKNEVKNAELKHVYCVESGHGQIFRPLLWTLQENDSCLQRSG